jgi:hypothetical protein
MRRPAEGKCRTGDWARTRAGPIRRLHETVKSLFVSLFIAFMAVLE